jgi:signal transduction histidine kinase/ActR/RegA family two-component response regulator
MNRTARMDKMRRHPAWSPDDFALREVFVAVNQAFERAHDEIVLAAHLERALGRLPGVSEVSVRLDEPSPSGRSSEDRPLRHDQARVPIATRRRQYGAFLFDVTSRAAFSGVRPAVETIGRATALWLEARTPRRQLVVVSDGQPGRSRAEDALKFLAESSVILAESLEYGTTLRQVARLAVPPFADWCVVDVVGDDGRMQRVEVAHADPERAASAEMIKRYTAAPGGSGRSILVEEVTEEKLLQLAQDQQQFALLQGLGLRSLLSVPLVARGRTLGVLTCATAESGRRYADAELSIAEQLAHRAALSIENARLYSDATQKTRSLQEASRAKDEFLAMLGHELRNPLSPIRTAVQLMRLRDENAFAKERAIIERQTDHLIRLVDDLLDVSRITRGKVTLNRRPVEIGVILVKAVEMASPLLEQRGHKLKTVMPDPSLTVDADEHRLAQVISNLLTNAAKYTEPGGRIDVVVSQEDGSVSIAVRDNGIGIDPELLERIFENFVQGERGLDRSEGGLGLGLAIVRSLVDMHGGSVAAKSAGVGKGSEFVVRLPTTTVKRAEPPGATSSPVPVAERGATLRVLIVDDNRDAAEVLGEALEGTEHLVRLAYDGPSALRVAAEFRPHVAVLDIGLPVMDGYELARRMRQTPGLAKVKLLALTGYGQESDRDRSLRAGFDDHLVKPVDLDDIIRLLAEAHAELSRPNRVESGA